MRNVFLAVAMGALILGGCSASTVFAPSLWQAPVVEHQFPWSGDEQVDETDAATTPAEPQARQDYESPIRVGCMEIRHSGRWRLEEADPNSPMQVTITGDNQVEAVTATLVSDHEGWRISVSHLQVSNPQEQLMGANAMMNALVSMMTSPMAQMLLQLNPDAFARIPEGRRMEAAEMVARDMLGINISPLVIPEHAVDAASFTASIGGHNIVLYGLRTDYDDPNTGIVVSGIWPADETSPIPLMDMTQIAANVRIVENCEP